MSHLGELTLTSDIMEGFCRNFPEYTDQMKVFIQRDTGDTSLCRTALSVLESFVTLLQQLVEELVDDGEGHTQAKGRTAFQAPEVDGSVYIDNPGDLKPGDFVKVKIVDGYAYDLIAERI